MTRDAAELALETAYHALKEICPSLIPSNAHIRALSHHIKAAIEKDRAEREAWLSIETAPIGTRVLVWGNGPVRFGYLDRLGQWRRLHHTPMPTPPTRWRHVPSPSEAPDQAREGAR